MHKVLLLEPNHLLATQYQAALERSGYTIRWCRDGQTAIEQADGWRPDVAVVELQLARHSGVEFLYEFKSYADWQTIPIVILTSIPRAELQAEEATLQELGVAYYLYKPETTLARLTQSVRRAVAAQAVAPAAAAKKP